MTVSARHVPPVDPPEEKPDPGPEEPENPGMAEILTVARIDMRNRKGVREGVLLTGYRLLGVADFVRGAFWVLEFGFWWKILRGLGGLVDFFVKFLPKAELFVIMKVSKLTNNKIANYFIELYVKSSLCY